MPFTEAKRTEILNNAIEHSGGSKISCAIQRDEFEEIVFDFQGIGFMGQGFADEVFRVFQNQHPKITLTVINANRSVEVWTGTCRSLIMKGRQADDQS